MARPALIIVDVQNDFLPPSGSLAVSSGRDILPVVLRLLDKPEQYEVIAATLYIIDKDHPPGHISFASTHNVAPFTAIKVPRSSSDSEMISLMVWPDHCVQETPGGKIEDSVQRRLTAMAKDVHYIRKGADLSVDAYSGFADNEYTSFTSLSRLLHRADVEHVIIVGLATDYCVKRTAVDARKFGFRTTVVRDAVRAVDGAQEEQVLSELEKLGCEIVDSSAIL